MATLFISGITFSCFSQSHGTIQKGYAFFKVSLPGNIIVKNGKEIPAVPSIERFIYLENLGEGVPKVDSVVYHGIPVGISIQPAGGSPVTVGINKSNGRKVILAAHKGNSLWKIILQEINGHRTGSLKSVSLIIRQRTDSHFRNFNISRETELSTPDSY